jgi:hypothetical protein
MEAVADENLLAIEGDDSSAVSTNGSKRVVTHSDAPSEDRII